MYISRNGDTLSEEMASGCQCGGVTHALFSPCDLHLSMYNSKKRQSSGAVWRSRWPSWAFRPNEPCGFCGHKETLNHAYKHWSQFVPNMSTDIRGHEALQHHQHIPSDPQCSSGVRYNNNHFTCRLVGVISCYDRQISDSHSFPVNRQF